MIWLLLAGSVGYLLGNWNADAVKRPQSSEPPNAAQIIARRFPESMRGAEMVQAAALDRLSAAGNSVVDDPQIALFEPEPMVPQQAIGRAQVQAQPETTASRTPVSSRQLRPLTTAAISPTSKQAVVAQPHSSTPRQASRPSYLLDAAQIASIKRRLRLTPDQERMWPAVEVALHNIGAEREHELHSRGSTAAIDPNSPQVEDLKSAAIPLLMSFSDEQKDEVRTLVHGMGLDQLASEF